VFAARSLLAIREGSVAAAAAQGGTHLRMDELLFGVLIAYLFHFRRDWFARIQAVPGTLLAGLGVLAVSPCFFLDIEQSLFVQTAGHVLLYLGFGCWLLLALRPAVHSWLEAENWPGRLSRGLAYLGSHSYSIYLWHVPMLAWGLEALRRAGCLPESRMQQFAIYLAGSVALGVGMARLVERPSLRLRDRLFPSRSASLPQKPVPPRVSSALLAPFEGGITA
jgi:peptidoglycan/LPS O-acetylase OafA/YrhL